MAAPMRGARRALASINVLKWPSCSRIFCGFFSTSAVRFFFALVVLSGGSVLLFGHNCPCAFRSGVEVLLCLGAQKAPRFRELEPFWERRKHLFLETPFAGWAMEAGGRQKKRSAKDGCVYAWLWRVWWKIIGRREQAGSRWCSEKSRVLF